MIQLLTVRTFLNYMESRGFTTAYRAKMKQALAKLLTYADNRVLEKLEDSGMVRIADTPPEIHPKSLGWL